MAKISIQTPTKIKLLAEGYTEDEIRKILREKSKEMKTNCSLVPKITKKILYEWLIGRQIDINKLSSEGFFKAGKGARKNAKEIIAFLEENICLNENMKEK